MPELSFAYASDESGDPFKSEISVTSEGVVVPASAVERPFALNARWFVEGFGYVWLEADNAGRLFRKEDLGQAVPLNLNREFARTKVAYNERQVARYEADGVRFSTETRGLIDLASQLLEESGRVDGEDAAFYADRSLLYGLWAGEHIELEKARQDIARQRRSDEFFFGCETRQYVWAKSEVMTERFVELFNYATVTHYVYDTWYELFEPREGQHRWGIKDNIVDWLVENDITVEGRPLFWFHTAVTPDWLKSKGFEALKDYVVRHATELVSHYGERVRHWEVVNEYHDWANIHRHTPDQITEIVRLACETTHDVDPEVVRIINNCCPFAGYAAWGHSDSGPSERPLRSPRKFVADLVAAEVPFDVIGVQMYFPRRSLAEIVRLVDRFAEFGKPGYITEIGASSGPTRSDILLGKGEVPSAPYDWHRPWDESLQADWLEQLFTVFYSKSYIQNVSWYDFADFRTFIPNGGLIRVDGSRKKSFDRLKELLASWDQLPGGAVAKPGGDG
jgi:GH35 family endo-1,4-beta-xylanase